MQANNYCCTNQLWTHFSSRKTLGNLPKHCMPFSKKKTAQFILALPRLRMVWKPIEHFFRVHLSMPFSDSKFKRCLPVHILLPLFLLEIVLHVCMLETVILICYKFMLFNCCAGMEFSLIHSCGCEYSSVIHMPGHHFLWSCVSYLLIM